MKIITLGKTGIRTPQNAFGALPVQRTGKDEAVRILRRAYEGGMTFFDTARAYTDSEEKLGLAFEGMREKVFISSKTMAKTPEDFWKDLETSLKNLKTGYLDIYQFHMAEQCFAPGDGTGMYECMLKAREKGMIRHIGVTAHKIRVAYELAESGLYETLQFPFSYLTSDKELGLVKLCAEQNVGFICMKALAGGLINRPDAAMAFISQYDNVLPIWGIQKMSELEDWLAFMDNEPEMTEEISAFIDSERKELSGEFCRGCGYCMPCSKDIKINQCARMSLMLRRAPSELWLNEVWQSEMKKIEDCIECGSCMKKCPYELNIPALLKKNYEDYKQWL